MTISSNAAPKAGPFNGNGVQTVFPFTFHAFAKADLLVVMAVTITGVETTLVLDSAYSVTLNADQSANPGGTVTYPISGTPLPAGSTLTIVSDIEYTQNTDLINMGGFYPDVIEDTLDRGVMQSKQVLEIVSRTLQVAVSTPANVNVTLPAPSASQLIGWNGTATGLVNYVPDVSSAAGLQIRLADTASASNGDALMGVLQPLTGAQATTQHDKNAERISLLDFIPQSQRAAILNFTSVTDCSAYILACFAAANGREIYVPAGKYNHATALTYAKTLRFHLRGEFAGYDAGLGAVFNYTGAGIGLQVGVDDGNPDSTGPIRDVTITGITFSTSTGSSSLRIQNTALTLIERNRFYGASGKCVDARANVLLKIRHNDIRGSQPASGNYGIYLDEEYFGNFVTEIEGNHIYQVNHAGRFCEGRNLRVQNNTVENIRPGATGGVWKFETSGYISTMAFLYNYYENHRGYVYEGASFTGAILSLIIKGEDAWGSGDAGNVNPGVGNLPKTKVFAHDIRDNFFVDSSWNTQAALALTAVYPTTSVFDTTTTIVRDQVTNKEYEDAIVYALAPNDLMKVAGDFSGITAGTPGTLAVGGSTQNSNNGAAASGPFGWTQVIAGAVWNAVVDAITGSWVCYTPGSGATFNLATYTQTLTPVAVTRYFVVGFTTKGWSSLKLAAASIYDSGASITSYHTEVIKFSVAPSAANFTLTLATNATASYWAEMRLYEIGSAEFNEPGALGTALTKAVKRLMRRGAY